MNDFNRNHKIPNAPCYKCLERHELCHSTCEKYISWRQEEVEKKESIRQQRQKIMDSYVHENNMRMRKKKGRNYGK